MEKLFIQTRTHPYFVYIGEDLRLNLTDYLPGKYSAFLIITDDHVADYYLEDCREALPSDAQVTYSVIPNGEQSKSIDTYYKLLTDCLSHGLDRNSLILALGGGVVGDVAGFVAATFMRGIDYVQIPTTILAHDSSVGGKVAINHELGKNLIGSFYPPKAVIYDTNTLKTLPEKEIRSGYAELVKEAIIHDDAFFDSLMRLDLNRLTARQLTDHLSQGIAIKANIVETDEREMGIRKFLNLGHTLGHAIEAELGYGKVTHGEAVAIGMIFALRVSEAVFSTHLPIERLINWLNQNHYPLTLVTMDVQKLMDRMKGDKKSVGQRIYMVLVKEIGQLDVVEMKDEDLRLLLDTFMKEVMVP